MCTETRLPESGWKSEQRCYYFISSKMSGNALLSSVVTAVKWLQKLLNLFSNASIINSTNDAETDFTHSITKLWPEESQEVKEEPTAQSVFSFTYSLNLIHIC